MFVFVNDRCRDISDEFLENNEYNVPLSRPIAVLSVVGFGLVEEFHCDCTDRSFPRFLYFYFLFSCFLINPTNRIIRRINRKSLKFDSQKDWGV